MLTWLLNALKGINEHKRVCKTMSFNKLSFSIMTIGLLLIGGAFVWWAISFDFDFDALDCFFQKAYFCRVVKYDPFVLYIGGGVFLLGSVAKYSMANGSTKNYTCNVATNEMSHDTSNRRIKKKNMQNAISGKLFRILLFICGSIYLIDTIEYINILLSIDSEVVIGFSAYLGLAMKISTATFFFVFFLQKVLKSDFK